MICSSGHKLVIIRALYEHLYPPCVLLMLQVCPDNAHLWTSSDLLKIPSFSSLFCHDAHILHSFLRHHRALSAHNSIIFILFMLYFWPSVALMVLYWPHYTTSLSTATGPLIMLLNPRGPSPMGTNNNM